MDIHGYQRISMDVHLYLWMSNTPNGPSVKFLVHNVHTMDELKLTGNSLMGSRPILSFDAIFEQRPQLKLLKEMLTQVFGTPEGHPKSKPFIDHVYNFSYIDGKIWFRNYQVVENTLDEKYWVPKINGMNWLAIRKQSKRSLKYP